MKRIGIIGGGISGLSAALRLSSQGYEVHIFEKEKTCGGKAGQWQSHGFRFDTGPSILTMPAVLEKLFSDAGLSFNERCPLAVLDENCRNYFHDGTVLRAWNDSARFAAEAAKVTGEKLERIESFLRYSERIYRTGASFFLFNSITEPAALFSLNAVKALIGLPLMDPLRNMNTALNHFFRSPNLRQMFGRYATYNGSDPARTPATFNLIAHVEQNPGGFFPVRGMRSIPETIAAAAQEKGVVFHYNEKAEKILHRKKRITGIRTSKGEYQFDAVISAADVLNTYEHLLECPKTFSARYYRSAERSLSAAVFHFGIRGIHPQLGVHTVLFSKDYPAEFCDIFRNSKVPEDPTMYIFISSRIAKDDAPADCENWTVIINAPPDNGQNWNAERLRLRSIIFNKIISRFGFDPEKLLLCESFTSPKDCAHISGNADGNLYGPSSNSRFSAFLRQQNRSRIFKGLYFCGGSAHPGGGVPLAALSGMIAADLLRRHL